MIECYFDDSGTHEGSRAVVWAGVVGRPEEFERLDRSWRALLAEPLPDKRPLRQFHLSHCVNAYGEFVDYRPAERDRLRNLFRVAIAESGVTPISYAVDVEAWDRRVTGLLRRLLGAAENCAFGQCLKTALEISDVTGEPISIYLDQGREGVPLNTMIEGAKLFAPSAAERATFSFASCVEHSGLQAADTVAYETYRFNLQWLDDPATKPSPQLQHLLDRVSGAYALMLDDPAIAKLAGKMRPLVASLQEALDRGELI